MTNSLGNKVLLSAIRDIEAFNHERFLELSMFVEDSLESQYNKIISELDSFQVNDVEQTTNIAEFYADDILLFREEFPRLQRYALFVSLVSMVEANIIRLCNVASRVFPISKKFNSNGPSVIRRGITFLEDNIGIDISRLSKYIFIAQNLVYIRNAIVHSQGSFKNRKEKDDLIKFIKNKKYLGIERHEKIVLKKGSIEYYAFKMHLFNKLLEKAFGFKYYEQVASK